MTDSLSVVSIDQYQLPTAKVIGDTGLIVNCQELALSIVIVLFALLSCNPTAFSSSRKNILTSVSGEANAVPSDAKEMSERPSHVSR